MAHWRNAHPDFIHVVRYEPLATAPAAAMAKLTTWLGLPALDPNQAPATSLVSIGTASPW